MMHRVHGLLWPEKALCTSKQTGTSLNVPIRRQSRMSHDYSELLSIRRYMDPRLARAYARPDPGPTLACVQRANDSTSTDGDNTAIRL
jgi:hypothetical protein